MFQSNDNNNLESPQNNDSAKNFDQIDANISAKNVAVRKQQIANIFVKLIAIGLAVGAVLGSGAYYLLHKFGMTKKPNQFKQERIEPEVQSEKSLPDVQALPIIPKSNQA
ncbi:MAG: hypothetical protein AAGE84_22410 [Cyanobacteria bacterium P01_G01_bin.39]